MTNPPAFPQVLTVQGTNGIRQPEEANLTGMTLRDYFAAKAMQAVIPTKMPNTVNGQNMEAVIAAVAYGFADAMLEARAKS
jgi:hypothetical protein